MSEAVNSVVNNLSDKLGEVAEMAGPIFEKMNTISETVMQETVNSGFIYTMVGIGVLGLAAMCVIIAVWIIKSERIADYKFKQALVGWTVFAAFVLAVVGFSVILMEYIG